MTRMIQIRGTRPVLAVLLALVAACAVAAAPASARQVTPHTFASSFDGANSTAGPFGSRLGSVAVDEATGDVYTLTKNFVLSKYDADGTPKAFTDPDLGGVNSFIVIPAAEEFFDDAHVVVDNSSSPTQGRIYVIHGHFSNMIYAFNRSGAPVGGKFPLLVNAVQNISVDPSNGDLWMGVSGDNEVSRRYTSDGEKTEDELPLAAQEGADIPFGGLSTGVDSDGNVYLGENTSQTSGIEKYDPNGILQYVLPAGSTTFEVDPSTNDVYVLEGFREEVSQYSDTGELIWHIGGSLANANDIALNAASGKLYVSRGETSKRVDILNPAPPVTVPEARTGPASEFKATSVKLSGTLNADSQATTECNFEWTRNKFVWSSVPCEQGNVFSDSADHTVSGTPEGLEKGKTYFYRFSVANANGTVIGRQMRFVPSAVPTIKDQWATASHSDSVRLHASISPEGAPTTYQFEYGLEDCSVSTCSVSSPAGAGSGTVVGEQSSIVTGLEPGTVYHYRVITTNQSGTAHGPDLTVATFPFTEIEEDKCVNAHVRQQVGAALLPDCRAYELVSAVDTGGYNVESDLVEGQIPYGGYPDAGERVLYGIHSGAIPGPWNPTNRGVDPYIATRGSAGWNTVYAGLPGNNPFSTAPFASELEEANATLTTLAFGGPGICSPCFADGSTGLPLRTRDGTFEQGMVGSEAPQDPRSEGRVRKRFSGDGSHLVFSSTSRFESTGNNADGDVSIYDRDLDTGITQLVSTDPGGANLTCHQGAGQCHAPANPAGIAELDISGDGSRIVVGQLLSTDADGNDYFHLYMHIGGSPNTVDLSPGTTSGVQYDGMTEDGSVIYFTTRDPLTTSADQDTDTGADIFRADVGTSSVTLTRVSTGGSGTGNTDACAPLANWNSPVGATDCSVLALAGGAGVASDEGSIYFLSPEKLDVSDPQNQPIQDQANLYVAHPGAPPKFVATIDTTEGKPGPPPPNHPSISPALLTGFVHAEALAVDESSGDVYVVDSEGGSVNRYTSSGAPSNFSGSDPSIAANKLTGQSLGYTSEAQIAFDNAVGSPLRGSLYVTNNAGAVKIYDTGGEPIGEITGFGEACGVAIDESTGDVYVGDYGTGIWRYHPNAKSTPVSDSDYTKTGLMQASGPFSCAVAADSAGHAFSTHFPFGPVEAFDAADFKAEPQAASGRVITERGWTMSADPVTSELYVDEGNRIAVFDSSGNQVQTFGEGLAGSRGVAIDAAGKRVYASQVESVSQFGYVPAPYHPIDNPAALHGLEQAETHDYGDFQATPDGRYAAFTSTRPLTGADSGGESEVFRYDVTADQVNCVSCSPSGARAVGPSRLSSLGLGLTPVGRVFFNSDDAIAPRDLDGLQDVYEWDGIEPQLISTGASPFDSSLLGVSLDGKDAFFFTRDSLVPQDKNGSLVKIYDARTEGGFPFVADREPCKASDECHGAGTSAPVPLPIGTITGAGGNQGVTSTGKCRKGFVRRGGHCQRRKHRSGGRHKRHANHGGAAR